MIDSIFIYGDTGATNKTMYANAPITADSDGVKWGLYDMVGWNNSADVKPAIIERPFYDGAVLSPFSYTARTLELHGGLLAPTKEKAALAVRWLKQAFDVRDSSYGPLLKQLIVTEVVSGPTGTLQMLVRRMAAIEATPHVNGLGYEFVVPLIAPDPRKYVTALQGVDVSGGLGSAALLVLAAGNFPLFIPLLRITGPVTNPIITHDRTGQTFKLNGALSGGQTIDLNMAAHTVGGTGGFGRDDVDVSSQWFPMLPGYNTYTLTGTGITGSTVLRAEWHDSFQ